MATANTIIGRSLRLLKVIAAGETIEAGIAADALSVLNSMGQRFLADGKLAAWTDAATVASALVTPAAQDEALAANLAVLIAPEFEMEPPASVVAMADKGVADLWRDRLADTTTAGTAEDIILRALRVVGSAGKLPDGVSFPATLNTLNSMLAEWHEAGIGLPDYSFAALSTALASDVGDREAIAYQLAVRLAPEYGVNLSAEAVAQARQSMFRLRQRYLPDTKPVPVAYY